MIDRLLETSPEEFADTLTTAEAKQLGARWNVSPVSVSMWAAGELGPARRQRLLDALKGASRNPEPRNDQITNLAEVFNSHGVYVQPLLSRWGWGESGMALRERGRRSPALVWDLLHGVTECAE